MTRKIGRYEIVGPLATGGMAEILLARLVGPSGFERPVVIKRIRRDLQQDDLVSLFLEEARLAAKVRHANVVHVEDLGTDEGAPYLVMEYLEGESLSNVVRRLKAREERFPFGLVAYIVAEACAGLHAAHELRDGDGELLNLVHRDVSPQNVFVTYGGAVKVVDFGIASTRGSTADQSELRGKFGYMAPEQIKGEPIDRRTDVFALGVVLYELLTEHRLFKRFNTTASARAVLVDPIVSPARVEPTVPAALEAICMRALARSPDGRYATASELRRELLVAMRELASEEPSAELAELMGRCFPDRIGDKRVLLRNVREGSVVDHVPAGDVDVTIELPGIEELAGVTSTYAPPRPPSPSNPSNGTSASVSRPVTSSSAIVAAPARRSRLRWALPLVILAAGTGASVRIVQTGGSLVRAPAPPQGPGSAAPVSVPTEALASPSASASGEAAASVPPSTSSDPAPVGSTAASTAASSAVRVAGGSTRRVRPPTSSSASSPSSVATAAPTSVDTASTAPSASARGYRRFQ